MPAWVKGGIINPCKNKLVLESWSFVSSVIYPFLPHNFCQRCHCTSQGNVYKSGQSKVPSQQCNPRPPNDSWALLWLYFQNRFGSLVKRLFWSTEWQGEEKSVKFSQITQHGDKTTTCKLTRIKFKNIKNAPGLFSFIFSVNSQHQESVYNSELKYNKLLCIINMLNSTNTITLVLLMHRIPELSVQSLWRNNFTSSAKSFQ